MPVGKAPDVVNRTMSHSTSPCDVNDITHGDAIVIVAVPILVAIPTSMAHFHVFTTSAFSNIFIHVVMDVISGSIVTAYVSCPVVLVR